MLGLRYVHHIALQVSNLPACEAFYCEILGLPVLRYFYHDNDALRSIWLQLGGNMILMLEAYKPKHPVPATGVVLTLAIAVAERDILEATLQQQGIAIVHRTTYTFYIDDPAGNRIGLSHWPYARDA